MSQGLCLLQRGTGAGDRTTSTGASSSGANSNHNKKGSGVVQQQQQQGGTRAPSGGSVGPLPGQQQQPQWRGQGLLGTSPQAHLAFALAEFSILAVVQQPQFAPPPGPQAGGWNQAGLKAALNQMALQAASPWGLGFWTLVPHLFGWYIAHPPSSITVGNSHSKI